MWNRVLTLSLAGVCGLLVSTAGGQDASIAAPQQDMSNRGLSVAPAPALGAPVGGGPVVAGVDLTAQQRSRLAELLGRREEALARFDRTVRQNEDNLRARLQGPLSDQERLAAQQELARLQVRRDALRAQEDQALLRQVLTPQQIQARNRLHLERRLRQSLGPVELIDLQEQRLQRALDAAARTMGNQLAAPEALQRSLSAEVAANILSPEQRDLLLAHRRQALATVVDGGGEVEVEVEVHGGRHVGFDDDWLFGHRLHHGFDDGLHHHRGRGRGRGHDDFLDPFLFAGVGLDDGLHRGRGRGSDDLFDDSGRGRGRGLDDGAFDDRGRGGGVDDRGRGGGGDDRGRGRGGSGGGGRGRGRD